jgi:hypothetical protein
MGVVVWGYRGGVGALRIPYKLSTFGGFRHTIAGAFTVTPKLKKKKKGKFLTFICHLYLVLGRYKFA